MKQKLSRKELLWGLAHEEERVFFPAFCYWMEQWLTNPNLPPFDAYGLDSWKKDKELLTAVPIGKISKFAPLTLVGVLKTKPGIDRNKVVLLLEYTPSIAYIKVNLALAALINVKKYWQNGYENPAQFQIYLLNKIRSDIDLAPNYDVLAAQLDVCPELFDILCENKMNVAFREKTAQAMVEMMNRLLVQISQTKDKNHCDVLKKRVNGYYQWLLDLRRMEPSFFTEISKCLDKVSCLQEYKVDGLANLISLKAEVTLRHQRLDWNQYLEYIISSACPYSYAWKLEILNILWEKELGEDTDKNLRLALHTLADNEKKQTYSGCQAFLKKCLERYPEYLDDVMHSADMLIKSSFARLNKYTVIAISDGDFISHHWQELPKALQNMWFWLLELGLQCPNWCYHLSLLEWWAQNQEQEKLFRKLVEKSLKSPWELDAETLYKGFNRVRLLVSCHKEVIYQEIGRFCEKILMNIVIDNKLWDEIDCVANYCLLDFSEAFDAQIKLREKKAKQDEKLKAQKAKEEAKIDKFLKVVLG